MSDFPHELIRLVQISTRSAAGLAGYDPNDPTLPALPSLSANIATLEPSPPYLRCKHCKGKLLRGLQSNICVYCGRRHENELVPDPIFFNSTIGYKWLLRSLSLEGSEMVKSSTNKIELDQGQSSPKAEILLSDFLNFKIAWPSETEKQDSVVSDKLSEENEKFLSLTGIAPDNFFFKSKRDDNRIGTTATKEVASQDNQNLFQNVQSFEPAGSSSIDKATESFSEWEADFQSAVPDNQHGVSKSSNYSTGTTADSGDKFQESKPVDHFTNSEVDLSAHMDSVFGPRKDLHDRTPSDNIVVSPAFSDWNSNDKWNNVSANESQLVVGFDAPVRAKDDHTLEKSNNLSTSADLFQDFHWQTNETDITGNKTVNEEHITMNESQLVGVFDATVNAKDDHNATVSAMDDHISDNSNQVFMNDDLFQDFQWQTNKRDITGNKTVNEEHITMNETQFVGGFDTTVSAKDDRTSENLNNLSTSVDLFQDFQWQTNETNITGNETANTENNSMNESHFVGSFDATIRVKDDHTSDNSNNPSTGDDLFQNFQWQTNEIDVTGQKTVNEEHIAVNESHLVGGFDATVSAKDNHTLENSINPSSSVDLFQDFQWHANEMDKTENKTMNEEDNTMYEDSFDEWNDFTGSASLQDPSQNSWIQSENLFTSPKRSSEIDSLGGTVEEKSASFSPTNVFSPSTGISNSSTEINAILSETATNRLNDVSSPSYESGQAAYNANDFGKSTRPEDDVKMLISQMHDLSFMLRSDLCIPSAADSRNSSSKD